VFAAYIPTNANKKDKIKNGILGLIQPSIKPIENLDGWRIAISTRINTTGKVIAQALHNNDSKKEKKETMYNFFLNELLVTATPILNL